MSLFVALGGVSYGVATGSIDSREVKDRSLTGNDLAKDRTGGGAIKESTLGQVPAAADADRLGGKAAGDYATRWALVNESGQIERQTGGFTVRDCYRTNDNCYIDADEDVTNNGLDAEIAVANTDGSAILSAQTGTAPCGATFVTCAPPNTEGNDIIVIAPRESDGSDFEMGDAAANTPGPPSAARAARFYVFVTGSQSQ